MHNLLRFIKINHFLLIFILIETISISLLLNNNKYQSNKVISLTTEYTGVIFDYKNSISDYIGLKKTNEFLIEENAKLLSIIEKQEYYPKKELVESNNFNYYPAKVINKSIFKRNNFLTINKGTEDGVNEGMGVITEKGVIGVIYSVSENYALVLSFLHSKSAVGIFLKKNMQTGILKWEGFDYQTAYIDDLPIHVPIEIGDTIITNSYSNIFPEGISIGKIKNFEKILESGFYKIYIKLFEDFNNLKYVYVVDKNGIKEQKILEGEIYE